jgi:hypothetical protein
VSSTDGWGSWCGTHSAKGADIILLSTFTRDLTVAHELGHALLNTGYHASDALSGFGAGKSNLMYAGDPGSYLSIGQLFRMNLGSRSAINRHKVRPTTLPQVDCPTFANSGQCPAACFDVNRDVLEDPEVKQCAP